MTSIETRHIEYQANCFVTVVDIDGPVDSSGEREVRAHLDALMGSGVRHVILDCEHVAYINSTGLGTLLLYMDKLEQAGGALILARLSDRALKVIEMLGFAPTLDFVESEAQAVEIISRLAGDRPELTA